MTDPRSMAMPELLNPEVPRALEFSICDQINQGLGSLEEGLVIINDEYDFAGPAGCDRTAATIWFHRSSVCAQTITVTFVAGHSPPFPSRPTRPCVGRSNKGEVRSSPRSTPLTKARLPFR